MRKKKKCPEGEFEAIITGLSHEGRGIARVDGKTTFIQFGLPGETVKFIYTFCKGRFDEGVVTEVLQPSPLRQSPICEVYQQCGGCSLQHLNPYNQIYFKLETLKEQMAHFGQVVPDQWLSPVQSPYTQGYRHKARLGVRYVAKKDKVLVGFRERNGKFITDMDTCPVLPPQIGNNLHHLKSMIDKLDIYNQIPQIEVIVDDETTSLIIRHLKPLSLRDEKQIKQFAQALDLRIYLQSKGPDTIQKFYPEDPKQGYLVYKLNDFDLHFRFQPGDFTQINPYMNALMVHLALELLNVNPTDRIIDLFCGLGNFALPLATKAQKVIGIEGDKTMVERAKYNASLNQLPNASFYTANLFDHIDNLLEEPECDKLLLDPPRSGAETVCRSIETFNPSRIVYISCNPATLARDAGILVHHHHYHLTKATVLDMFPHTTHTESIAVFEKS